MAMESATLSNTYIYKYANKDDIITHAPCSS